MKLNKVAMAVVLTAAFGSASAMAAAYEGDPTSGVIELQGVLVNSACGLKTSPVIVDFGQVPVSLLQGGGQAERTKNIELQYCDTTIAKTATVTYTPVSTVPTDATLAAFTSGSAKGAGIALIDSANQQNIQWGTPGALVNLVNGDNVIPFVAVLKKSAKVGGETDPDTLVTAGTFTSTINFTINYQ